MRRQGVLREVDGQIAGEHERWRRGARASELRMAAETFLSGAPAAEGRGSNVNRSSADAPVAASQRRTAGRWVGSGYLSRHSPIARPRSISLFEHLSRVSSDAGSRARNAVISTGSRGSLSTAFPSPLRLG